MADIKKFWQAVVRERAALPADVTAFFVTSIENDSRGIDGGVVVETDREITARLLAERTHRLSTTAEIEKFHSDSQAAHDSILADEYNKKQQYAMPPEMKILMDALLKSQGSTGARK